MRTLALLVLAVPLPALASSETDLPPALRADVSLGYAAQVEWAGFEQDSDDGPVGVGKRRDVRHDLAFRAAFAPVDGIAVTLGLDHLASRSLTFDEAREMWEDPGSGKPTYIGGNDLTDPPSYSASGLEGLWFGMAFQPFAERFRKQHEVTWRLDLAVRTAPPTTFWEAGDDGKRGAGLGGPTFKVAGAFSRDHESTSPYMTTTWQLQTRRQVDAPIEGGTATMQVDPGQRLDVVGGLEIRLTNPEADPARVDLDLSTGFSWRSEASVPSGVLLPDVLTASEEPVLRAEQLGWHLGGAFEIDIAEPVSLHLYARGLWRLPWLVEEPYPVRTTLGTAQGTFGATLIGRIR